MRERKNVASKVFIDLDAIIPVLEPREVQLGGRKFVVSDVPVGVVAAFSRVKSDPTYTLANAMVDGSVAMLNQGVPDGERITTAWFLEHVNGVTLERVSDAILAPFYNRFQLMRERETVPKQETLTEEETIEP